MKNIKDRLAIITLTGILLLGAGNAYALTGAAVSSSISRGPGLDLFAVSEIFKVANTLEHFEEMINSPETGINNLDLDENGKVDYLRVEEQAEDGTHLIVLQTQFADEEFQDVATIALEKENDENYQIHIQGDPLIYGENFYIVPVNTNIATWRIVRWIYRPGYIPYRSIFGFRVFPKWWRVRRPVAIGVYQSRTVKFVGRRNFTASKTVRVKTVSKINYRPRTSTVVKRRTVVVKKGNKKGVKRTVKVRRQRPR